MQGRRCLKMSHSVLRVAAVTLVLVVSLLNGADAATTASNPFIWADIPDLAILRVGDEFYMSHTTMHMAPGVPIMKR